MINDKKLIKWVVGGSLIVISGVTLFYQYRFSKVQANSKEYVVVATKLINFNDEITEDNAKVVRRDKADNVDGNVNNLKLVLGSVATETIYKNEDINLNRVVSAEEYKKKDYRLVSIKCTNDAADALVGYDVKPNDKVDLLYFDKKGTYEGKIYLEGQVVYDLKSAEGVSYADKKDTSFVPKYALIWVEKDQAVNINEKQEQGGYFKFQLYRGRAKDKDKEQNVKSAAENVKNAMGGK